MFNNSWVFLTIVFGYSDKRNGRYSLGTKVLKPSLENFRKNKSPKKIDFFQIT